ncbi:MAG: hypothetical protein GOMPHAMPRED_007576 [Gomphillus americanus]|uniref:Uncharacterized protein n=1 Tax=Gomphillus americanus TaxID=1940652 RepID=A0A8H3ESZ8_9LECA|nr:MAG: hypothetical protein GOMPHAMPRED_007576 [Gomphillus americanus]
MASVFPVAFSNIAAIETMMAGFGNARCKSLGIGRQDNYNHIIHRPRDAHQDPKTKTILGRIYQHRVFTVNQPNGRIIWVFERSKDNMLFLISPRKGPLAYKVWLSSESFSETLWLYGQNFQAEEKAAELRGPSDLQQWLRANRPQDAGTTGEYTNYKAHIAQLAAPSQRENNSTAHTVAPTDNEATLPAIPSSAVDEDVQPEKDIGDIATNLPSAPHIAVPTSTTSKPILKPISKATSKTASTTASTTASKKKPATRPRKTATPAPSSRSLRSAGKAETLEDGTTRAGKRKADDAELDGEKVGKVKKPPVPLPELNRPPRLDAPKAKPKSKKRKYISAAARIITEKEYENHCKQLLYDWSPPTLQDSSDKMDLDGIDFVSQIRSLPFKHDFRDHSRKTLIRYNAKTQDIFGGRYGLEGEAITIEVSASAKP